CAVERARNGGEPLVDLDDAAGEVDGRVDRGRTQVVDRHRRGGVPERGIAADRAALTSVRVGDRGADAVAVEQRSDDAAVEDVARTGRVERARLPCGDGDRVVGGRPRAPEL